MIDSVRPADPAATPVAPANVERALLERHVREYQVVRELGRGGMGVVFLARDVALHRLVAIKVLRHELSTSEEQRERFRREARVTARLTEGVVAVHGFGERESLVYIVMEFVRGVPLSTRLRERGTLSVEDARAILMTLARTLELAHSRGIVHRDLKPENVLLDSDSGRALLTDFGIALTRSSDPLPYESGLRAFGTAQFMSPEQASGDTNLDGRSDLYSLGVLGYLMLTGTVPFDGDSFAAIASRQVTEAPKPIRTHRPEVSEALSDVVERCLRKDPAERWRRCSDLADALEVAKHRPSMLGLVTRLGRFAAALLAGAALALGYNRHIRPIEVAAAAAPGKAETTAPATRQDSSQPTRNG